MLKNSPLFSTHGIKAVLLMGGTGMRFGSETPKQFHRLAGKKVYLHTLEIFLSSQLFEQIVLVCPQIWIEEVEKDLKDYPAAKLKLVIGGATRQDSSFKGLEACGDETKIVVIHDAVRPFLTPRILQENVESALKHAAVDTCIPSADTLVYAPQKTQISTIPYRADYLRGQTPQSFSYPLVLKAHLEAKKADIANSSDDCSLVLRLGQPVHIVLGDEENIKITSELDLYLAEQLLRLRHIPFAPAPCSLLGKKIAVSGGTGGIGSELCKLLREQGAIPIVLSRSSQPYQADLTSSSQVEQVFQKIQQEYGPLDGLVNGIGLLKNSQVDHLSSEEIDLLISTNLTGVIYSCKYACLKKGAHIINIASSSYARGRKNFAVYSSAKAAVVNFTQGLAEERPDLFINALVPQRTLTSMRLDNFPNEDPATLLHPTEVAKEVLHLLGQTSITGSIIEVKKR